MNVNSPIPFDESLVNSVRVNRSAIERRIATLPTRRTFKGESQVAAYLRAIQCLDLTTLAGDDTPGRVERLCAKALSPISSDLKERLKKRFELDDLSITVGAVCVYQNLVETAVRCVNGKIPVAAVSTGFPAGQTPFRVKLAEFETSLNAGAEEIDIVISRSLVLLGKWRELYGEIREFRYIAGERGKIKTILGVGNLGTLENVAKASVVAILAGSDFIKTSTGFEPTNATFETGLTMVREIRRLRDIFEMNTSRVGFKPAGGIRAAKDATTWLILMKEELGEEWTKPDLFRIGASTLLGDIERQLSHLATSRYSAAHHHPLG